MKISYNWIKDFVPVNLPPKEAADLLTDIGLEVEGFETIGVSKERLNGIVVGHVLEVWKHPNADKLRVTKVDLGELGIKQIVCGAPNVESNQKVAVATLGTKIFLPDGDSFEIKKAKIRGEESEGMICAEDEIGIGKSHEGIVVLPEDTKVGIPFSDIIETNEDVVFEIGLTPNRSDAYSHYGVARDLAAAWNTRNEAKIQLKFPEIADINLFPKNTSDFSVQIESKTACPRYAGVVLNNIKIAPSPEWLKSKLTNLGLKPINNVVDITNWILHELGQPLHAFDMNVVGKGIIVKNVPDNTEFKTLDDTKRKLSSADLMICNQEKPMCIAGVFGGLESGVKENTTSIFLESAYFSSDSIRKTSLKHGLRTEAAVRFEKGIDPNITVTALLRAVKLLQEEAGAQIASPLFDIQSQEFPPYKVTLTFDKLNKYAGVNIPLDKIETILSYLDIQIVERQNDAIKLEVAPYRVDVTRDVDVIEEIIRIYGINNLPIPEKINAGLPSGKNEIKYLRLQKFALLLNGLGFSEILTNSITKSKYYTDKSQIIPLLNSLNADLDIMRPDMLITGLEVLQHNVNRKNADLKFFELGKTYRKLNNEFNEEAVLSLYATGNQNPVNWKTKGKEIDFYYLKSIVINLLETSGIKKYTLEESEDDNMEFGLRIFSQKQCIAGIYGVKKTVTKKFDIDKPVFFAEIFIDKLNSILDNVNIKYQELIKFPGTRRDLSLLLDKSAKFQEIIHLTSKVGGGLLKHIDLFDVYIDDKIGEGKKSYAVSFYFVNEQKTITDEEVEEIMNKIIQDLKEKLNAIVR